MSAGSEKLANALVDEAGRMSREAGNLRIGARDFGMGARMCDRVAAADAHADVHRLALRMEALSDDLAALSARLRVAS